MAAFTLGILKVSIETSCKNSYHPLFSSPDGDVILRSTEGTLYRLHSYILRTSAGLFETMFSLPQPKNQPKICCTSHNHHYPTSPDILDVYEADSTMEQILKLIYGIPTPPRMSFDEIETILALAEKWDTQGPYHKPAFSLQIAAIFISISHQILWHWLVQILWLGLWS